MSAMTPKQRTALLAIAIVGGLFVSVACLITALVVANRDSKTTASAEVK